MSFVTTNKELTLIYNSNQELDRVLYAYTQDERIPIRAIDLKYDSLKGDQWAEIAEKLNVPIKDLMNKEDPDFLQHYKQDIDLNDRDWLTFLSKNPKTLRAPIVMQGEKVVFMENPQDMLRFVKKNS